MKETMMDDMTGYFQGEFASEDNEEIIKIPMSFFKMDCVTFFGSLITRKFPDTLLTLYVSDRALWRPQQRIHIPDDLDITEAEVDEYAFELQERLFWDHGVLVSYVVTKGPVEEADDYSTQHGD